MMFETYVGALRDASAVTYLRPETLQRATARLVNRRGVDGAPIPVVARGEGRFEIDLPLSNIALGEWLLAIDAASKHAEAFGGRTTYSCPRHQR